MKKRILESLKLHLVAVVAICLAFEEASGWGGAVHRYITLRAASLLAGNAISFVQDSSYLSEHSVDADYRKVDGDTTLFGEAPRHYLDIDEYPDYCTLPHHLDSLIVLFGWERVKDNGTNPWAIVWTYDSLVAQLGRGDWGLARQSASDLAHYVEDAHQPLHATVNYNGQMSGNYGIHSRYESTMLSSDYYLSELTVHPEPIATVANPLDHAFGVLLQANALVDSVLQADNAAKVASGWNGSGTPPSSYYAALWERTRTVTLLQVQRAAVALASLWYSALIEAGMGPVRVVALPHTDVPPSFRLGQNFPNPFNPSTALEVCLPCESLVRVQVFDPLGRRVAVLFDGWARPGRHVIPFDASGLVSGAYYARLEAGTSSSTVRMLFLK